MSLLALSASFEYQCYGYTTIINILILLGGGGRGDRPYQNLTSKDAERANTINRAGPSLQLSDT